MSCDEEEKSSKIIEKITDFLKNELNIEILNADCIDDEIDIFIKENVEISIMDLSALFEKMKEEFKIDDIWVSSSTFGENESCLLLKVFI